jgi:hypothetical protein
MHRTYVQQRLDRWASWSWQKIDGQLSRYVQVSYRERTDREFVDSASIPLASECIETEQAVSWLRTQNRRMGDAVVLTFRDHPNYSSEMIARLLGVCRQTLWRDLAGAEVRLLDYFNARAAGLPLPQLQELRSGRKVA